MAPFRPDPPLVIGLTGGVAAGKSTVARSFARHGLAHVDADAVAREVAGDPGVREAVVRVFGPAALAGDRLDREHLAGIVFDDPGARRRLEAITHPPIRRRIEELLARHREAGTSVVLDVPLLIEGGLVERCDRVVFVDAGEEQRERRSRQRGWPPGERARRERAQASTEMKTARADATIHNDGPPSEVDRQVDALLTLWQGKGGRSA